MSLISLAGDLPRRLAAAAARFLWVDLLGLDPASYDDRADAARAGFDVTPIWRLPRRRA